MKRRDFIAKGGIVGAGVVGVAALSGCEEKKEVAAPAVVADRIEIAMVSTWPRDFPGLGTGAQRFAASLAELSDGRMNVTYYAAGERVKPFDSFDEVASGNAQMYHAADYYWKGNTRRGRTLRLCRSVWCWLRLMPGFNLAAVRNCGMKSRANLVLSASAAETRAFRWAAGSEKRSTQRTISKA